MVKQTALTRGLLLTLFLAFAPAVRADAIQWSYDWTRSPNLLAADPNGPNSAGTGGIILAPALSGSATNSTDIVAFNLSTFSSAPDPNGNPDRFTNKAYTLSVKITDTASNESGTANFSGTMSGTLTKDSANITNLFNSPTIQKLLLGGNQYTVTLNSFTPPGKPGSENLGAIGAHVDVQAPVVEKVPEPSTLLLGATGCAGLLAAWRRRRVTVG